MFWNKIPKGYVETVDGYLIKESEVKMVIDNGIARFYRKENAPAYDERKSVMSKIGDKFFDLDCGQIFYKNNVLVTKDGTPIGYHTPEEIQKLKDRIKELEDKYEPKLISINEQCGAGFIFIDDGEFNKPKNKKGKKKK